MARFSDSSSSFSSVTCTFEASVCAAIFNNYECREIDRNVEAVTGGGADIKNLGYAGTGVFSSHSSPAKAAANPTSPAPSSVLLNFLSLMQSLATHPTVPIDTLGILDTVQRTLLYHTL